MQSWFQGAPRKPVPSRRRSTRPFATDRSGDSGFPGVIEARGRRRALHFLVATIGVIVILVDPGLFSGVDGVASANVCFSRHWPGTQWARSDERPGSAADTGRASPAHAESAFAARFRPTPTVAPRLAVARHGGHGVASGNGARGFLRNDFRLVDAAHLPVCGVHLAVLLFRAARAWPRRLAAAGYRSGYRKRPGGIPDPAATRVLDRGPQPSSPIRKPGWRSRPPPHCRPRRVG